MNYKYLKKVCTQWGDNFALFQKHVTAEFGWTLEEVE